MRNLTREVGQRTWVSSGQETIDLPRDYAYIDLLVELVATITVTAGTTAGTVLDVCPAQMIKNIQIIANGRDTIKSLDFEALVRLTHLRYGTAPNNTLFGGTATTTCYVYAIIPFAMWRSVVPFDTLFNAKPLTTLQMILTFGTVADIFDSGASYDYTYSGAGTVYVSSREAVGLNPDAILSVNKESVQESTVTATTSSHQIGMNYAKDLYYRSIVLRCTQDGQVSNGILNDIELKSGGVIFFKLNARRDRARYKNIYGVETMPTGYYAIDFCEDGRLGDALNTSGLSSLDLILDVTNTADVDKIRVYTTEVIVPTVVTK